MASGCIVGDCSVCEYPVFEDEWSGLAFERYDKFIHIGKCQQQYEHKMQNISSVKRLNRENERLKNENILLKKQIKSGQMFLDI